MQADLLNAKLDDTIQFSASNNSMNIGSQSMNVNSWYDQWQGWGYSYPSYSYHYHTDKPNAFELAFKIVSKMLEKKIIQKLTLRQFIETINEVAKLV